MKVNDEIELYIEKFTSSAQGIAHHNGQVIFVKDACPKDKVLAKITNIRKNFANAEIMDIIEPSPYRVVPFCPMYKHCGACSMQFIDYDYQLELKSQMVKDALYSIGQIDFDVPKTEPSPTTKNYRHKIQYPVSQKKVSKRPIIGYYMPNSHFAVDIKHCPIQPEICDKIIDFIRENAEKYEIEGYDEKSHSGLLRHVILRVSNKNSSLLLGLVINSKVIAENLRRFADDVMQSFSDIKGVCVNFNTQKTNLILGAKTICIKGQDYVEDELCSNIFKIGLDTFFQVNPQTAQNLFGYVKEYIKNNFTFPTVLDAYAGIASIGMCVSDLAKNVTSVELVKASCEKAKEGLELNKIKNLTVINEDTAKFIKNTTEKFDIIITDPPKKGSTAEVLDGFLKCCKKEIIYVSCNPATLARDLRYLINKGCKLKSIKPFDMFCHTNHVETVAIIEV